MTILTCLQKAKETLKLITDQPMLEAELLLAWVIKKDRSYLSAHPEKKIAENEIKIFNSLVRRRVNKEPLAYILGKKEFWSLNFKVTKDTLIPREETEILVETTLKLFANQNELSLLDLGTGSGAIAIAIAKEKPQWKIFATDISKEALEVAQYNANKHGLSNIHFYQGDWFCALPKVKFDVILSNPPYLSEDDWHAYGANLCFEPQSALFAGNNGYKEIDSIVFSAQKYLTSRGTLIIEQGFSQGAQVKTFFLKSGFSNIQSVKDLSGHERVTLGQYQY